MLRCQTRYGEISIRPSRVFAVAQKVDAKNKVVPDRCVLFTDALPDPVEVYGTVEGMEERWKTAIMIEVGLEQPFEYEVEDEGAEEAEESENGSE